MQFKSYLSAVALAASASAQSLNGLIANEGQLAGLGTLLETYTDLRSYLASQEDVTIFAPSNIAISELQRSGLLNDASQEEVGAILMYHVVSGMVMSSDIQEVPTFLTTMLEDPTYTNVTGGQVISVQLPDEDGMEDEDSDDDDEDSDSDSPLAIVTSGLKQQSNIIQADLEYDGGVVHVIDSVLTVPPVVSETAAAAGLTALVGALTAADLVEAVNGASDITVFAPSNDAFAAIGSAIGDLSTEDLAGILQYHVINGTVGYSTLLGSGEVASQGGDDLSITVEDGAVFVNAARVIVADILVAGGVVHVIDSVLNPDNADEEPMADEDEAVVQFPGASSGSLDALTSGVPEPSSTVAALAMTTDEVADGYPTQTEAVASNTATMGSGGNGGGSSGGGGSGGGSSSDSDNDNDSDSDSGSGNEDDSDPTDNAAPIQTGAMGAAALFGGAAILANF